MLIVKKATNIKLLIYFYYLFSVFKSSSRRGRPPKQGPLGLSLSSYHNITDEHGQPKKYRMDDKELSHNDISGKFRTSI